MIKDESVVINHLHYQLICVDKCGMLKDLGKAACKDAIVLSNKVKDVKPEDLDDKYAGKIVTDYLFGRTPNYISMLGYSTLVAMIMGISAIESIAIKDAFNKVVFRYIDINKSVSGSGRAH